MSLRTGALSIIGRLSPRWIRRLPRGRAFTQRLVCAALARSEPRELRSLTKAGFVFIGQSDDVIARYLHVFGVWEPDITAWVAASLHTGDVVLDVGANSGYFSLLASQIVGPEGLVISVEPVPTIFHDLMVNLEANSVTNVTAYQFAAAAEPGYLEVYRPKSGNPGDATTVRMAGMVSEGLVEAKPLDSIFDECDRAHVRIVKIDTEGDELNALRGMRELLIQMPSRAAVIVELTPDFLALRNQHQDEVFALMSTHGFDPFWIPNDYTPARYSRDVVTAPRPLEPSRELQAATNVVFRKR